VGFSWRLPEPTGMVQFPNGVNSQSPQRIWEVSRPQALRVIWAGEEAIGAEERDQRSTPFLSAA
jgi:hypothetical protein